MPRPPRTTWRGFGPAFVAAGLLGVPAPPSQAQPASTASRSTSVAAPLAAETVVELAEKGRFAELAGRLVLDPGALDRSTELGLPKALGRFARNRQKLVEDRVQTVAAALSRAEQALREARLDDAMVAAIEAHSLAPDPAGLLEQAPVADLVQQTAAAAEAAEAAGDWVEASVLYGRLNLLFDADRRYRSDVERIGRHIRALNLYHPSLLQERLREREQRLGRAQDQATDQGEDEETWEQRLRGVRRTMLRDIFRLASDHHIEQVTVAELTAAGLRGLEVLLETRGLEQVFPGLMDRSQVDRLLEILDSEALRVAELEAAGRFNSRLAQGVADALFEANAQTVGLPEPVLAYEFAEGAMGALDDFSAMYWPEDVDHLRRSTHGQFPGVGIQITRRDNQLVVISPLPGTPAQAAGVLAGDVIETVDGRSTTAWSLNKAVREITGPQGTEVELGLRRQGEPDLLLVPVTRKQIAIESIKGWAHTPDGGWDYWLERDAGLAYIRLTQFMPQTAADLDAALATLQATGELRGLILDLRFNPGGLLNAAIDISNRFVDSGDLLYTVDGDRRQTHAWSARRRGTLRDLDVVILINRGSASASEIVAGSLQDHGRAFVVGSQSYGKGSVQNVFWRPNDPRPAWGIKVTTEHYQLPGGDIIHRTDDATEWGIVPDLELEVPDSYTAWAVALRQELDVLRENAGRVNLTRSHPAVVLAGQEPVDPDADDARELIQIHNARPIHLLELGLDPQLEAAALVLKARALAAGLKALDTRVTGSSAPVGGT